MASLWHVWRRWVTLRDVWKALPGTSGDGRNSSTGGDSISDFIEFIIALPFLLSSCTGQPVSRTSCDGPPFHRGRPCSVKGPSS